MASLLQAQVTQLEGRIISEAGGGVDSAEFRATNRETGQATSGLADERGVVFLRLPVGTYTVTVRAGGHRTVEIDDITLNVAIPARVNVTLKAGEPSQTPESMHATETQSVISTSSAELATLVDRRQILDLPLNGRNPLQLSGLQAGVSTNLTVTEAAINGLRGSFNNVVQDGVNIQDNFDRSDGLFGVTAPSVENVLEFSIVTQNSGAESGFGASQIRLVTPSGGNQYHGSLFYFHRNSAFNANSFFNNATKLPREVLRRHQFGGRLGGPVLSDRLFLFAYYEGTREAQETSLLRTVLTESARDGIFTYGKGQPESCDLTGQGGMGACSVDLYTFTSQRPDTTIGNLIQDDVMPLPNDPSFGDKLNTAGFRFNSSRPRRANLWGFRVDYSLSRNHSLEATYSEFHLRLPRGFQNVGSARDIGEVFPGLPGGGHRSVRRLVTAAWRADLSRKISNEFRWGLQRPSFTQFQPQLSTGTGIPTDYQLELPLVDNPIQNSLTERRKGLLQEFSDNVVWVRGRHNIHFGGNLRLNASELRDDNGILPTLSLGFRGPENPLRLGEALFPGNLSARDRDRASQLLALLTGTRESARQTFNATASSEGVELVPGRSQEWNLRQRLLSFYAADTVRIRPNLTLNLGLRWEWHGAPTETSGLALLPVGGLEVLSSENAVIDRFGSATGRPFFRNDLNNFAPTVGLAWDPWGDGRSSLRAGYTVSYVVDNGQSSIVNALNANAATSVTPLLVNLTGALSKESVPEQKLFEEALESNAITETGGLKLKLPRSLEAHIALSPLNGLFAIDPELRTPYVQQWNLSLSRQLFEGTAFEARYVGNRGIGLARAVDLNQPDFIDNGFLEDFNRAQFNLKSTGNPYLGRGLRIFPLLANRGQTLLLNPLVQRMLRDGEIGELLFFMFQNQDSAFGSGGVGASEILGPELFYPNPNALFTSFLGNNSFSSYHSLQTELRRRFGKGVSFQANYTFSKVLTDFSGTAQNFSPFLDVNRPSLEGRRAGFDLTHAFAGNFLLELPVGPGRRYVSNRGPLGWMLEGWQASGIINWRSGPPLSILSGRGTFVRREYSESNTVVTDLTHSELQSRTGDFRDSDGNPLLFDPPLVDALKHPEAGSVGTLGLTPVSGPGFVNVDMSLIKRMRVRENFLEFHAEFFNVFNNVNWQVPRNAFGDAVQRLNDQDDFGRIFHTFDPRIIQFALKLNF